MKGYISRTTDELEKQVLTSLMNGLNERIAFLGEVLMELEEDECDFHVKQSLVNIGYNCIEEDDGKTLDDIETKKHKIINELNDAKNTYKQIEEMLFRTYC